MVLSAFVGFFFPVFYFSLDFSGSFPLSLMFIEVVPPESDSLVLARLEDHPGFPFSAEVLLTEYPLNPRESFRPHRGYFPIGVFPNQRRCGRFLASSWTTM